MNYRMICQVLGRVLILEGLLLILPMIVAICYGESVVPFLITGAVVFATGGMLMLLRPENTEIYAQEGFVCVGLSWILLSLSGTLPFLLSGDIPHFMDALFETVSGFTTTGASILTDIEALSRSGLFWRSFTQWIGGMGVLVFVMAVLPMSGGRAMHIMRAEVPGPTVGKLVPRMRRTATILYMIYIALTVIEVCFLLCGGLSFYDALVHTFSTAATGGFSCYNASVGQFDSVYVEMVIAVFILLFGVNFNLYYMALIGKAGVFLKSEEFRAYVLIVLFASLTMAWNLMDTYGTFTEALRYTFFQVSSIITTTGYSTANYDLWPIYSRWMLFLLFFAGACAGSTSGSIKLSRFLIMLKAISGEFRQMLHPSTIKNVRMDKRRVDEETVHDVFIYCALFFFLIVVTTTLLSLEGFDFITTFTASVSCLTNVGPGLGAVGPMGNFSEFSDWGKLLLSFAMLIGRLEIYPVLLLFAPATWRAQ